ncbi:hypothetical protein D9M71_734470 [compost metagenome]
MINIGRKNRTLIRLNFMPKLRRFISAMAGYNKVFTRRLLFSFIVMGALGIADGVRPKPGNIPTSPGDHRVRSEDSVKQIREFWRDHLCTRYRPEFL